MFKEDPTNLVFKLRPGLDNEREEEGRSKQEGRGRPDIDLIVIEVGKI